MNTDGAFHYEVLALFARRMRPDLYIGYGIEQGKCLLSVLPYCQRVMGVDDKAERPAFIPAADWFSMTTERFSAEVLPTLPPVDMAFIDADHRSEKARDDLVALVTASRDDALILMHDTYPENEAQSADEYCSDSYLVPWSMKSQAGIEVVTLPFPPGLSIFRKVPKGYLAWRKA